jgi:hypothetical protein
VAFVRERSNLLDKNKSKGALKKAPLVCKLFITLHVECGTGIVNLNQLKIV